MVLHVQRRASDFRERALYLSLYHWLVLPALLCLLLPPVLLPLGGTEANAVAGAVLARAGVPGMTLLKTISICATLAICQFVGRRRWRAGQFVAHLAVGANTAAVTLGCTALMVYAVTIIRG